MSPLLSPPPPIKPILPSLLPSVEPVDVVQPDGRVERYPKIATRTMRVKVDYMNSAIGISQTPAQYVSLLSRMSLQAKPIGDGQELEVEIGPERSDILHPCDIMEDAAVAYGYNRIPRTFPRSSTIGNPMPIQKLSDQVRRELALSGFSEVLPLILVSFPPFIHPLGLLHGSP